MLVSFSCFVHSEILLDYSRCKHEAFWSFEHSGWNLHQLSNFVLVVNTVKHFFFTWLIQILSCKLNKLPAIHIRQLHVIIREQLFKIHQDKRHWTPLVNICPPERNELRCLVDEFTFPEHQLMQGVLVHELVVTSGFHASFSFCVSKICLLRALVSSWCRQSQLHGGCFCWTVA